MLGCSSAPDPEPSPTPAFASEEEAFAAAEETYRAYIAALNAVEPDDPGTFEPLFALSSGSFERADRKNLSTMHAEHQNVEGNALVTRFTGASVSPSFDRITAMVCLDVSNVSVTDTAGRSLVRPDRPSVYGIEVTFRVASGEALVDAAKQTDEQQCAQK